MDVNCLGFYGRWTMEYMDPLCADTKTLSHLRTELDLN